MARIGYCYSVLLKSHYERSLLIITANYIEFCPIYPEMCFRHQAIFKTMLLYCQLATKEHTSVKFRFKFKRFHSRKCTRNCLRNGGRVVSASMFLSGSIHHIWHQHYNYCRFHPLRRTRYTPVSWLWKYSMLPCVSVPFPHLWTNTFLCHISHSDKIDAIRLVAVNNWTQLLPIRRHLAIRPWEKHCLNVLLMIMWGEVFQSVPLYWLYKAGC